MRIVFVIRVVVALLVATILLVTLPARAAPAGHAAGRISLSLPGGARGPLVLTPGQGGWVGQLTISNLGSEALIVSRVAIRDDEDDVRSPARLGVRFVDGAATSATLPPGASKDVVVSWMPDRDPHVRQAFGHVVVTSTDEEAGEVAMGFRAQVPTGLGFVGEHPLSLFVALPFAVVLAAAAAWLTGRREDPFIRYVALGASALELVIALWVWARFVVDVGRADGNDGFQFVERAVWVRSIGAEWYLGVDGLSVALVVLVAVLGFVALVATPPDPPMQAGYYAAHALLVSGLAGAFTALDLVVLFASWQVVLVALAMLVGGWGGARAEHAASKIGVYGAIGSLAMLAAFIALSRGSGRTFLVDGAPVAHTLSIPELARTSFALKAPILGVPFVEVVWVLLFIAVAVATPLVPFHGWLLEGLEEAPAGIAILIGGVVVGLGPYLLLRVGLGAAPEGARWAGASMAALGVVSIAYGSLCAMTQRDLRRFTAYATIASGGAGIFGVSAFTSSGVAGALAEIFVRGLASALLLGVAGAFERRLRTCEFVRLGALAKETPVLLSLAAFGLALSLGVPLLAGFWGPLLVLLGTFARYPVFAVVMAVALIASTAAHLRVGRMMVFGKVAPERLESPLRDAMPAELAALVPLALLALLLGVWPAPLLSEIAAGVHDAAVAVEPLQSDVVP